MSVIQLQTLLAAPPERCFDLSRSIELHLVAAASTSERVISGPSSGLLSPGDTVTWEARHFGLRHRLTVRITTYERPVRFRDEMISGPFRRMRHDHWFEPRADGTLMRDEFDFASVLPLFDTLVLRPHLRRFLLARNETIRMVAESEEWRRYLND